MEEAERGVTEMNGDGKTIPSCYEAFKGCISRQSGNLLKFLNWPHCYSYYLGGLAASKGECELYPTTSYPLPQPIQPPIQLPTQPIQPPTQPSTQPIQPPTQPSTQPTQPSAQPQPYPTYQPPSYQYPWTPITPPTGPPTNVATIITGAGAAAVVVLLLVAILRQRNSGVHGISGLGDFGESRYCRERLEDPAHFDKRSFRTIDRGKVKVIIGCPKGFWDSKRKKCKVGTRAQALLWKPGTEKCPEPGIEFNSKKYKVKRRVGRYT